MARVSSLAGQKVLRERESPMAFMGPYQASIGSATGCHARRDSGMVADTRSPFSTPPPYDKDVLLKFYSIFDGSDVFAGRRVGLDNSNDVPSTTVFARRHTLGG
jgi:hypothetical protein